MKVGATVALRKKLCLNLCCEAFAQYLCGIDFPAVVLMVAATSAATNIFSLIIVARANAKANRQ